MRIRPKARPDRRSSGVLEQLAAAQTPGQPEMAQPLAAGAQQQPGQDAQQQGGNGASCYYCQGHRQIVGELPHQQAQCGQGKPVDQPAAAGQRRQLPAQHAQGGNPAQAQQGWQGKAEQGNHAGSCAHQKRPQAGAWQVRRQQFAKQVDQPGLHQPAAGQAEQGGEDAQTQQLQQEQPQGAGAAGTQAAQQGAGVEVALGKTTGGQGHGDSGQHHGGDTGEPEELVGAGQGTADLPIVIGHRGDALVTFQARLQPAAQALQIGLLATDQQAVTHPAARLDDPGCRQVAKVHQYPGSQAVEVAGAVGFMGQYRGHP